jgi:hypothetical protein
MVHAQRHQLAASPDKNGCALCIVSWNVQLLWPQAGAMPLRAACIAERLLALNADIVCLQVRCALRRLYAVPVKVTSIICCRNAGMHAREQC